jgi:small subunit ribosomal protein S6
MYAYETLLLLRAELPEAQVRETVDRAKRLIEERQGAVSEAQDWGVRELAYPVQKSNRGYYYLLRYSAAADVVWELERTLKIADEVMRFVSVRQETKKPRKPKRASRPPVAPPVDEDVDIEPIPEDF